ncbi:hypothetical protein DYB32_003489 [Aphanomyces invadans]|uniref:Uncharacterized protein n=1 Tax=Aphanomyces invadans TaxID=157072 RepID=A0A3R7D2L2_9STRA|nr:hypothetical protein DYB32_003489 [Aphanomyces invadans]
MMEGTTMLKAWDEGTMATLVAAVMMERTIVATKHQRKVLLDEFAWKYRDAHLFETTVDLNDDLGSSAGLYLSRILSWLRLNCTDGDGLAQHIRAIAVFLRGHFLQDEYVNMIRMGSQVNEIWMLALCMINHPNRPTQILRELVATTSPHYDARVVEYMWDLAPTAMTLLAHESCKDAYNALAVTCQHSVAFVRDTVSETARITLTQDTDALEFDTTMDMLLGDTTHRHAIWKHLYDEKWPLKPVVVVEGGNDQTLDAIEAQVEAVISPVRLNVRCLHTSRWRVMPSTM